MNAERARRPDLIAALKDAAVVIAALLADPFDRSARMEARTWLTTWMAAQTKGATKGGR
jgi:hypothetical protein